MQLFVPLIAAMVGYLFGIVRDRSSAIRTKQIEAMTPLHERVLEIERKEISDGKSIPLAVLRGFPLLAILVEAGEGDSVPRAGGGFVPPNRRRRTRLAAHNLVRETVRERGRDMIRATQDKIDGLRQAVRRVIDRVRGPIAVLVCMPPPSFTLH